MLHGRVALVTGSGRNIGRAVALALARAGAAVVVNGQRDTAALTETVALVRAAGGAALAVQADVADRAAVFAMVAQGAAHFGAPVEIVVANVGLREARPFLDTTPQQWQQAMAVNLDSAFHLAQAALPGMLAQARGRFVHLSGLPVLTGRYGGKVAALASKAGLHGLTKGLADEFGGRGITANLVAPGMVRTARDWRHYPHTSEAAAQARIPAGRIAEPEDVAAACVYLAGDGAAFVNGQTLHVNGGEVMF
ncbi:SDR family NAD(P)-dependent oxidoreductase [Pseudorhodoferax sp.]|uniref:SDR family NAD(P)-dependent oxidoreductase n=1 Tax=Pseudorhodoferax sp. TaxID=1993553 RepID=UPI002DD638CC|nr:SDR family oxidoreductase [Pseudorhodoferax sp.]